jgi:hypothetical protein
MLMRLQERPSDMNSWRDRLESLDEAQQEMLLGSSLSQRFAAWPLSISHPAIVGAFYGLLLITALIIPLGYHNNWIVEQWFSETVYRGLTMALGLALAGQFSALVAKFFRRPPISPPRMVIFSMPFIGFILLLGIWMGFLSDFPETFAWILMLAPGPIYVHLSWAPRYRMLTMLEDGMDPFGPSITEAENHEKEQELEAAVDAFLD